MSDPREFLPVKPQPRCLCHSSKPCAWCLGLVVPTGHVKVLKGSK